MASTDSTNHRLWSAAVSLLKQICAQASGPVQLKHMLFKGQLHILNGGLGGQLQKRFLNLVKVIWHFLKDTWGLFKRKKPFYLLIITCWRHWVSGAVRGLLLLRQAHWQLLAAHGLLELWPAGFFCCSAQAWLPHDMWDLNSLTRDRTCVPCAGRQILNHWSTKEVPRLLNMWIIWVLSLFTYNSPWSKKKIRSVCNIWE